MPVQVETKTAQIVATPTLRTLYAWIESIYRRFTLKVNNILIVPLLDIILIFIENTYESVVMFLYSKTMSLFVIWCLRHVLYE